MLFHLKECRAIFGQSTDQGAFDRVYRNKEGTCETGYVGIKKAQEGYDDTVAARKFVDGNCTLFKLLRTIRPSSSSGALGVISVWLRRWSCLRVLMMKPTRRSMSRPRRLLASPVWLQVLTSRTKMRSLLSLLVTAR